MVTTAVLERKDADDVDDEAEDRHEEQSLVVNFRRLKETLQPERVELVRVFMSHSMHNRSF